MQAALAIDEIGDLLFQTGYRKPISLLTIQERYEIASALIDFHLMAKVKCIMDQFIEGLKAGGVLDGIVQQPNLWEPLFVLSSSSNLSRGVYYCAHAI